MEEENNEIKEQLMVLKEENEHYNICNLQIFYIAMTDQSKILFIYKNLSNLYAIPVRFVTSDYNVYECTISRPYEDAEFINILQQIAKKIKPTNTIDKSALLKAYDLIEQIDPNRKLKTHTLILGRRRYFLWAVKDEKLILLRDVFEAYSTDIDYEIVPQIYGILAKNKFFK